MKKAATADNPSQQKKAIVHMKQLHIPCGRVNIFRDIYGIHIIKKA